MSKKYELTDNTKVFYDITLAKCIDGKYILETHSNNSTAKTPMGAFETDTVENDVMLVLKALEDY